ncbi:peptide ABC transporter substrate-binding protein [Chloroflexota bacterium]
MKNIFRTILLSVILITIITLPLLVGSCSLQVSEDELNLWDIGPLTLDPAISSDLSSHTYVNQIYSGLVYLNEELKPSADIAEKWQISEDRKVYTFTLREGILFHSGREVTAQDFKYSWERACDPETKSQVVSTYLGDIVGVNDVVEGRATGISGVKVIDDYTIEVSIDSPKAYFLAKLSYPTSFVVDRENVESSDEWWRQPNGTGPFQLMKWEKDHLLILQANEGFYRQPPQINRIVFHLLAGNPMALYETGEIDVTLVTESFIEKVKDEQGPFFEELHIYPELSSFYLGFNTLKPPFDDVNVRKAFCMAVNKEKIIGLTMQGTGTIANGILPPNIPGYNENLSILEYDVEKAKGLIKESKYGSPENLPPITLTDSGQGGDIPDYLGAIIQDWRQNLGVEVSVRQLQWEIFSLPHFLKQELDEIYTYGWIADYPDPQNFLDVLFRSEADHNVGGYSNIAFDALLDKGAAELDETTRDTYYQQAEQILISDAGCLPLWYNTNFILVKPYVKNYAINAMGVPTLRQVNIQR